jgi:HSP20 family molecular chaperone IbpA
MMRDPKNLIWAEACAMIERAERLQRQFFSPALPGLQPVGWQPPIDIYETDTELLLIAALPGVEHRDLDVAIDGGELVIAGTRRFPALAPEALIHRLEIPHGRFERRIRLPATRLKLSRSELVSGCLTLALSKEV